MILVLKNEKNCAPKSPYKRARTDGEGFSLFGPLVAFSSGELENLIVVG